MAFNKTRPKGGFWGVEPESEVRFLKFSSEGGEIGPPTAKSENFKIDRMSMKLGPRGVFWGVEHESELRFLKFSSEGGEIDLPQRKLPFLKFLKFSIFFKNRTFPRGRSISGSWSQNM